MRSRYIISIAGGITAQRKYLADKLSLNLKNRTPCDVNYKFEVVQCQSFKNLVKEACYKIFIDQPLDFLIIKHALNFPATTLLNKSLLEKHLMEFRENYSRQVIPNRRISDFCITDPQNEDRIRSLTIDILSKLKQQKTEGEPDEIQVFLDQYNKKNNHPSRVNITRQ